MTKPSRRPRGTTLDPNHPARDLQELLTENDKEHMRLCLDAEARCDVEGALKHYLAAPHVQGAPQLHDLRVLRSLDDAVPAWAWSRWICDQAHRWLLFEEDPRIRDAVLHTIVTVHTDLDALHLEDPDQLLEIGTRLAVAHWITAQLLLFEFSGVRDFVDVKATPELLGKADDMEPWVASVMGGYRIIEAHDDVVELVDLANGSRLDVLNIGAATGVEGDAVVIGRVVPISTAPGLMFESRPLEVDDQTARDVSASDGLEWLNAVYEAVVTGRLPEGYGMGGSPPLMSDVVPDPPTARDDTDEELPGRIVELVNAGLSLDVANAVATCEVALIVADVAPDGLGAAAPHASLGLIDDVVFEAALEHCTTPDREQAWRRFARSTAEPVRSRCERLADACRQEGP